MRTRHVASYAFCAALLLASTAASAAEFPPPEYKPAAGNPLDALHKAKLDWLTKKMKAEEIKLKHLKEQAKDPDSDEKSFAKAIKELDGVLTQDKKEHKALSETDALKPNKNGDAAKHAKLIKDNVQGWIERLDAMRQSSLKDSVNTGKSKEEREQAKKDAKKFGDSEDALKNDLAKAEKDSPALFK